MEAVSDWSCQSCGFSLWMPVQAPTLSITRVGLYDDARFPCRCIVVFDRHIEGVEALDSDQLMSFWKDVVRVGTAVRRATGAVRINYAVLGNVTAHLHAHVIPRQPSSEPLPTRSPWSDPRPLVGLNPTELARFRRVLASLLA